jgi:hypothetical protein
MPARGCTARAPPPKLDNFTGRSDTRENRYLSTRLLTVSFTDDSHELQATTHHVPLVDDGISRCYLYSWLRRRHAEHRHVAQ